MNSNFINRATKIIIDIMFFGSILCTIAVPFLTRFIGGFYGYDTRGSIIFAAVLFVSGAASVYILFNMRQMFNTLVGNNPFVMENADCLRRIAAACAVIVAVYAIKCVLLFTWASVVIAIVFAVGALFCLVLEGLFRQAVAYKEENDWTV